MSGNINDTGKRFLLLVIHIGPDLQNFCTKKMLLFSYPSVLTCVLSVH